MADTCAITITDEIAMRVAELQAHQPLFEQAMDSPPTEQERVEAPTDGCISLVDAMSIVESYGPLGNDVNEDYQIKIVLRDEVIKSGVRYRMAAKGRADFRQAYREIRDAYKTLEQETIALKTELAGVRDSLRLMSGSRDAAMASLIRATEVEHSHRLQLAARQASEKRMREALYAHGTHNIPCQGPVKKCTCGLDELLATPSDSTALTARLEQARTEGRIAGLKEASKECDEWYSALKTLGNADHVQGQRMAYKNASAALTELTLAKTSEEGMG